MAFAESPTYIGTGEFLFTRFFSYLLEAHQAADVEILGAVDVGGSSFGTCSGHSIFSNY
jgi:hypothetical protein